MKNLLIVLGLGIAGTGILYFTPTQETVGEGAAFKTVKYTGVSNQTLDILKSQINELARKAENKAVKPAPKLEMTHSIEGVKQFQNKLDAVFGFLKESQLLYRHEFYKSFDRTKSQLSLMSVNNFEDMNAKINNLIDYHLGLVSQLKTSAPTKNKLTLMLNDIRNPFKVESQGAETVQLRPSLETAVTAAEIRQLLDTVKGIKKPSSVTMEFHAPESTPVRTPIFVLWGILLSVAALIWRREEKAAEVVEESFQADVNPTLKKIITELDYPLFVCDTSFNLNWQNNTSKKFSLNAEQVQKLVAHHGSNSGETFDIEGRSFNVQLSELNYKNGKKNLFIQMKPVAVASKYTEHLVDATQVELLLENNSDSAGVFKDFNQTVADLAVKMNYLFKVSGKFLDIDFKKDIADCFVENSRLETMCREFILSCHYIIKDKEQVSGIYLRTDELGQRFALGCFLPGLSENDLTNGLMARDFLKKFSILEAKFSLCLPTIDIKTVSAGDVKGVDISLSFENRSQMESLINQSFATM